jgi:hypothetical protein
VVLGEWVGGLVGWEVEVEADEEERLNDSLFG